MGKITLIFSGWVKGTLAALFFHIDTQTQHSPLPTPCRYVSSLFKRKSNLLCVELGGGREVAEGRLCLLTILFVTGL